MARVTGPLFSMSASGTIGKAVTYGTWKGRPWARVWFKPQNPKSAKQVNVRTAMRILVAFWQGLNDELKGQWDVYAVPFGMSGFNKMVERGMDAYVIDPGTGVLPTNVMYADPPPGETWTWNTP